MDLSNRFIEKHKKEIQKCVRCGFCQCVCPVFDVTLRPAYTARGRIMVIKEVMKNSIRFSPQLADLFYSCTTCKACSASCPAKVEPDVLIMDFRNELAASGYTPAPLISVQKNLKEKGNVFASSKEDRIAIFPPKLKEQLENDPSDFKSETTLFLGCVPSYVDIKVVPSLIKILHAAKETFMVFGTDEPCCGFPLYLMGSEQIFENHANKVAKKINTSGVSKLITPCPGCYKTFKELYPKICELDAKVYHVVHFMAQLLQENRLHFGREILKRVTYHDPCDLGRSFKVFDEPRYILSQIPGLQLVEMANNRMQANCCGAGGGLQANNPDLSVQIASRRIREALQVGAEVIVSACSACKDNLKKGLRLIAKEDRSKIKVMDITELLAIALD